MPSAINIPVYSDALVLLGTAGIVIPLVRRFGFNPVLGYLGAGAILGPLGLGSFIGQFPFLYWFTVVDARNVAGFADLGIVFLLFLIGMELSYERLKTMRRLVFGLGSLIRALNSIPVDRSSIAPSTLRRFEEWVRGGLRSLTALHLFLGIAQW